MEGSGYIKSLDGVRAIAIILVMSFHADLTHFGWIGVQLFFVLSGFLITGILWKEKSKPGTLQFKFKKFWVRRSLRIFPLYYAYLLVIGLAYLIFHFPSYFEIYFPYAVSYTINFPLSIIQRPEGNPLFHHLWSLSIEEQFYLLFPLIILLSPKKFIKYFLVGIILVSPLIRFLLGEHYTNEGLIARDVSNIVNFNTLCQLDAFCIGGIISVLSLDSRIKKPLLLLGISAILVIAAGVLNYISSPSGLNYLVDLGYYHYFTGDYQHVWQYTCLNILFASFILSLVSMHSQKSLPRLRSFLENKWMIRIGKVSYGMYIYHWLVWAYLFNNTFKPDTWLMKAALFIPYLITVFLISELSYKLFEVHFINLKDRFFPPQGGLKKVV